MLRTVFIPAGRNDAAAVPLEPAEPADAPEGSI